MHQSRLRLLLFTLAISPSLLSQCGVLLHPAIAQTRPAPKKKVSGVVVNEKGQPIPNAVVVLVPNASEAGPEPSMLCRTDDTGHFAGEFEPVVPPDDAPNNPTDEDPEETIPKRVAALIYAPGYALERAYLSSAEAKIVLQSGVSAAGKVKDSNGQPVPGVRIDVQYLRLQHDDDELSQLLSFVSLDDLPLDSPVKIAMRAVTGADGTWTIPDLPLGSRAYVHISDPRFISKSVEVPLGETRDETSPKIPDIVAMPGASVTGRVLYPDGKPVVNAEINGQVGGGEQGYAQARSAPDGSFTLLGLPAGKVKISVAPPSDQWAPAGIDDLTLQVSTVLSAPNITLSPGTLLSGTVTDSDSKKPLSGVQIIADGPFGSSHSTSSDEQGRYSVRTVVGSNRFYVFDIPRDYLRGNEAQPSRVIKDTDHVAPDFSVRRGITLQGTALDEAGQPAAGATISSGPLFEGATTFVGSKGKWILRGVDPNTSRFYGGKRTPGSITLKSDGAWEIAAGAQVSIGTATPIALTLRHIKLEDVAVRVTAADGTPLANTAVKITRLIDPASGMRQMESGLTNARGEIMVRKLRPEMSAEIVPMKEGYSLLKAGTVAPLKDNNPGPRATDAVLMRLDATVQGLVVDADGKTVGNVRIAPLQSVDLRVFPIATSDKEGKFLLDKLQRGTLSIGAAIGRQWGHVEAAAGETVAGAVPATRISLSAPEPTIPGRDLDTTFEFLDDWRAESGRQDYEWCRMVAQFARFDSARAVKLLQKENGKLETVSFQSVLDDLVESDPALAKQLAIKYPDSLGDAKGAQSIWLSIAAANIDEDPAEARAVYDRVAPGIAANKTAANDLWSYALLTGIAGHLNLPDAAKWQASLDAAFENLKPEEQAFDVGAYLKSVAQTDLPRAEKMLAQLSPAVQVRGLEEIIPVVAKRDMPAALRLLTQMEELVAQPGLPVPEDRNDAMYRPQPTQSLDRARSELIEELMKTDISAAYEQVKKMGTSGYGRNGLRARVVSQLPAAQAIPLLQQEFEAARNPIYGDPAGEMAYIATLMMPLDASQGEEMFKQAKLVLTPKDDLAEIDEFSPRATSYAFYRAAFDPAESRLYLESEWRRLYDGLRKSRADADKKNISRNEDGMSNASEQFLQNVVWAMMPVSYDRAVAMQQQLALLKASDGFYQSNMVTWLLATDVQRARMSFQIPVLE